FASSPGFLRQMFPPTPGVRRALDQGANICSMTSDGSASARFRRALEMGNEGAMECLQNLCVADGLR
ncbi:MAG: hypothetical protein ACTHQQ_04320, partial [Solirubrobacteraceae bacterium]